MKEKTGYSHGSRRKNQVSGPAKLPSGSRSYYGLRDELAAHRATGNRAQGPIREAGPEDDAHREYRDPQDYQPEPLEHTNHLDASCRCGKTGIQCKLADAPKHTPWESR